MRISKALLTPWAFALLVSSISFAAPATPTQAVAVLQARCLSCHGESVALSGLRLNRREDALRGGAHGPAIVPGKADESLLVQAVRHAGKLAMPPTGKLSDTEIETLRSWVESGASWPSEQTAANAPTWWSFRPPVRPTVPNLASAWVRNPIDAFVLAKLQQQGLSPAPEADRLTLIRRATFDLHGLPPTAAEVQQFMADAAPDAYDRLIDRLLASPRYGEKWGKHWLDLVRYGDTSGFEQDPYQLYAWRYRDYVIQSFNEDKPYDRFVKEQLAGDEIWPEEPAAQVGTGYFTVGANRDMLFKVEDINRVETLTDFVDTTSSVFLGLTMGCARCHDHKFDPLPQRDYYRMQAIFVPAVKTRIFLDYNGARSYDLGENTRTAKLYEIGAQLTKLQAPYRERLRQQKMAKLPADVQEALRVDEAQRTPQQKALAEANRKAVEASDDEVRALLTQADAERLQSIEHRLAGMFRSYAPGPFAPGVEDVGREAPHTYLPAKGGAPVGERVEPGFPTALGGGNVPEPPVTATSTGRRRALAEWLANPQHPLTARVMVNRAWQYHFGRGLVATPSDFGTRSTPPSHPELLDWLATEFMQRGWSLKQIHRLMMTSGTYRQAAHPSPEALQKDPENIYLSHANRRRLDAEEVRDSVLQAAGVLNLKMGGRPVVPPLAKEELYGMSQPTDSAWITTADPTEQQRRSIYLLSRRTFRIPLLEVFDRPDGVLSCSRRDASTTAPQSLTLLNGDFTLTQARHLTAKLVKETDDAAAIRMAWQQTLARDPQPKEAAAAAAFLQRQTEHLGTRAAALTELARGLFNLNEFLYVE